MKSLYLLGLCLIVLFSCSKDDTNGADPNPDPDPSVVLKACFSLNKDTGMVGEYIKITSCSKEATAFLYDFGNGETSVKENPEILLKEEGDFTIVLKVTDAEQNTDTFSRSISVTQPIEAYYIFPGIESGFVGYPLETGINPISGQPYYIELRADKVGAEGAKFYYRELDENYNATSIYIADRPFDSESAFVNFLPSGNRNFHFSRTLPDLFGTQEVTYTDTWGFVSGINSAIRHSYGYLVDGSNFLYFGTKKVDGIYKTAIERRNASGDAFEEFFNGFGSADSMIGDMIQTDNGYIAYGAVFSKNTTAPYITDYKPMLVFLDIDLNVTSHIIYEDSALTAIPTDANGLNGPYHLGELSNGNLVLYGKGELIVTDNSGNKMASTLFDSTSDIQALISLGDSFIISTDGYLKKFDANGDPVKELKYNGNYLPEILEIDDNLFFVAGYDTLEGEQKLFYGASDKNLNPIDLNK